MGKFKEKLKNRQVYKVATIYALSVWPLIQIADLAIPSLGLPDSILTLLLQIAIAGFPVSLLFAWFFNFTDDGIVRASSDSDDAQNKPQANVMTTLVVTGTLTIVLLITLGSQMWLDEDSGVSRLANETTIQPADTLQANQQLITDGKESIAILPFIAFSSDPQDEFFADGMVEELLNLLAKIPDLRVAARTSSFAYKGINNKSISQIGGELGVNTILEGSIRRNDTSNKIRVTAQLVKVSTGEHLWSQTYDREYRDIFQIQDEIARSVVEKMQITLLGGAPTQEFIAQTNNVDAMVAFGKGQKEMEHRTAESLNQALEHFQQAISLDKHYARAYAAMADTYNLLRLYGHMGDDHAKEMASNSIDMALSLDDELAEAYAAKGLLLRESDESQAEASLQKAIALNPNYPSAYMWYGTLLRQKGDLRGAHRMKAKAFELDPKSPVASYLLAMSHYRQGDQDRAMELFSHIIANDPYYPGAYNLVGDILLSRGRLDESVQMYKRALDVDALNANAVQGMLLAHTDLGFFDKTEQWFEYAKRHDEMLKTNTQNMMRFRYHMARGERDQAIDYLDTVNPAQTSNPLYAYQINGTKAYMRGEYAKVIEAFEAISQLETLSKERFYQLDGGRTAAYLAFAYAQMEMPNQLNELLAGLDQYLESEKETRLNSASYYYTLAMVSAVKQNTTETFHYLQGAIDVGWVQTWQVENDPIFAGLRNDIQYTLMIGGVERKVTQMRERMTEDEAFMLAGAEEI